MSRHFPSEEPNTVFLLIDKWASNTFGEYEAELLNYVLHDNIRLVFLLVTDYGITQIPFLPNDRDVFKSHGIPSNDEIITIENNIPMNVLLEKLRISPFRYSYSAGTLNVHNNKVYFFNIDDLTWIKRMPMGFDFYREPIAEGGIDLHIHSTASDGTDTIPMLLEKLRASGIGIFSVTDHDTITGALEMQELVPEDMTFIKGIEFSCVTSEDQVQFLLESAMNNGLYVSGGSDYHGQNKTVQLGELNAFGKVIFSDLITLPIRI